MKSDDEDSKISNNKYNKTKNITNKQKIKKSKTNLHYNKSLWNQQKYQVGTWCKPKFQQSLSHRIFDKLPHIPSLLPIINISIESSISSLTKEQIVDIIPHHPNEYPSIIQTSLGSNMSSLTKEKHFKKKNNKVENFLHKWKHSRNKKTKLNNTLNKQNTYKATITHFPQFITSSISSSSISEHCDNKIPSNRPSLNHHQQR